MADNTITEEEQKSDAVGDAREDSIESSSDPLADDTALQNALIALYGKAKGEDRYPRLIEVKDVKKQELYWSSRQYIWWSTHDEQWNLPTQGASNYGDLDIDDMPRYEYVTNIYQARGLMMIAAVAGAPPRVRFFPEDADDENDIETAQARTKLARLIQRWNPVQKLLQEEAYHAWTGGFIAWWVRYVENGEKYGLDEVQLLSESELAADDVITCPKCGWKSPAQEAEPPVPCPECGTELTEDNISEEDATPVPEESDSMQLPKGREIISVYGALNCNRPQYTNQQSQWHYFGLEDEIHYSILRAEFEDVADKIKPGLTGGQSDVFERNARLSVAENAKSPTQTAADQANLCTFVRCWYRPGAFWMLDDAEMRTKALKLFPRGCRIEFTGNVFCRSKAESMDDAVVSCHAMPGRGQHRPSVGDTTVSLQDRVNTLSNIEMETYEYGIPITYRASDTFDSEADEDQRAAPGLEVEVALRAGENIQARIMQVRADSVSPDMAQHAKDLIGPTSDLISGTYPAVSGAGAEQGAPDTVGQQVMQRDQAMGRMGIFYVNLKQAHADIMTIGCRDLEAHSSGTIKIPVLGASGDFESESVDVTALEGEAEAYPEGDENFPDLWNQQRSTMMAVAQTPYGAALVQDPENAELMVKLLGIQDLKVPNIDSIRKQLKEISELTKVPDGDEMLTGIAPTVEVDSDDFQEVESMTCKLWMSSEKGQRMKRENPMGWQAVKEHKAQHDAMIKPPPPAEKPLSKTLTGNMKDLPPAVQVQILAAEGVHASEDDFINAAGLKAAEKNPASGQAPLEAPPNGLAVGEPSNAPSGMGV